MIYVNLNPHDINLIGVGVIPSSGLARVKETLTGNGIFKIRSCGDIEGLPKPKKDTIYIVSSMVMNIAVRQGRTDVYAPTDFIRDKEGKIIGCESLCRDDLNEV